jgi:hypothetical protein
MEERARALLAIVEAIRRATVRQSFYQATLRGLVEKTEAGYKKVQRMLVTLRRDGRLPWDWISDNTRWMRKPRSWDSIEDALEDTARAYRRNLWTDSNAYVEIWCEKDALAGVLLDVTRKWDVPLMVARGYSSLTFLNEAATNMAATDRPCFVYHFGDYDPSGQNAAEKIGETLREFAPGAEIRFERVAVLPWQIEAWGLPTRPTKGTDSRSKRWTGGESVELDAIRPDRLRAMCEEVILRHVDHDRLRVLLVAEEDERRRFEAWRAILAGKAPP